MKRYSTETTHSIKAWRIALLLIAVAMLAILFSCSKTPQNEPSGSAGAGISAIVLKPIQAFLKDSLTPGAYDSLEFSRIILDTASTGNLFFRVPSLGVPVSRQFIAIETTPGLVPLKAAWLRITPGINLQTSDSTNRVMGFNGSITRSTLGGDTVYSSPVVNGLITVLNASRSISTEALAQKNTDSDFDGTGEELAEIVITAPTGEEGDAYFLDLEEIFDSGEGAVNTYVSANGSGSSLGVFPSSFQNEQPAINVAGYLGCFSLLPNTGATYSVTIYASIPTSNPLVLSNASGGTGQTFLGLSKTAGNRTTTQYIGFFPDCPCDAGLPSTPSKIVDMGGSAYNASYTLSLNAGQFATLLFQIQISVGTPYAAGMSTGSTFAVNAINSVDPGYLTMPSLPVNSPSQYAGTPNAVFFEIQNAATSKAPGATTNANVQSVVGSSHGNCGGTVAGYPGLTPAP
ncbi:MAG: hypothetical protein P4L51_06085 [Puia sp.]|nr:hypothetical protein [Puia sp.]